MSGRGYTRELALLVLALTLDGEACQLPTTCAEVYQRARQTPGANGNLSNAINDLEEFGYIVRHVHSGGLTATQQLKQMRAEGRI